MIYLGMVIDVAHAHYQTLQDIAEIAGANGVPIIDSHTSLSLSPEPTGSRRRTWTETELVAGTGGLICTWPLQCPPGQDACQRLTIDNWAEENYQMKERLGARHIALGTDGGGLLPGLVDGYQDILNLPNLVTAMYEKGFVDSEIDHYMGKNMVRILKTCIR
jgi:microsomal dipeptidase-like Zn-dependent dipeptidase